MWQNPAKSLCNQDTEGNKSLLALRNGELDIQLFELIERLSYIQKLGLPLSLLSKETVDGVHQFIYNRRPDLELYDTGNTPQQDNFNVTHFEPELITKRTPESGGLFY